MSAEPARTAVLDLFDSGAFLADLEQLIGYRTESQDPDRSPVLHDYLTQAIGPRLETMGFGVAVLANPVATGHPILLAHRVEDPSLPTVMIYGHADVQWAHREQWRDDLDPWRVTISEDRWYGRGVADNKGQHLINLVALEQVLRARGGRLGYNVTVLIETAEEIGSPGLAEFCAAHSDDLAADLFIGSDGPRLSEHRPTVFLGSRGVINLTLELRLRDGSHHSGNWGGVLRNPATILASAIATIVDSEGRLLVDGLRPSSLPDPVRRILADVRPGTDGEIAIDTDWGEPGLTPAERLYAWNTFEVLAFGAGDVDHPVNAIPGAALAHCQLRFIEPLPGPTILATVRDHLDRHGFGEVELSAGATVQPARTDPADPWVSWAVAALERATGIRPAVLPGIGGTLPNGPFASDLGLPTIWIPHSYPGCRQHAPDEHLPAALIRQALVAMVGVFSELADLDRWPPGAA